jgi:hypothetical protein
VINKNIASNLKRMRADMLEVARNSGVNQNLIANLLDQAIIMEQVLQIHFDHYYSSGSSIQVNSNQMGFGKVQGTSKALHNNSVLTVQSKGRNLPGI